MSCTSKSDTVSTSSSTTTSTTSTTEAIATDYQLAFVTDQFADKCGYMLEFNAQGSGIFYSPVTDLPKSFQKNGTKVMIKFRASRAPQKEGCTQGKPIVVEDIKKVK